MVACRRLLVNTLSVNGGGRGWRGKIRCVETIGWKLLNKQIKTVKYVCQTYKFHKQKTLQNIWKIINFVGKKNLNWNRLIFFFKLV